ncbi:MAG: geranylgeranyl reductase family protein [Bacteroidia bacterium]|nr:geranylgeranyl reductase family protein [Bacteroidia bacterium]
MKTQPVVISGAGPGGAVCALFLAKAGIPVIVADKAIFPRDKICGDALSGKVVEVIKKLDPTIIQQLAIKTEIQVGSWGVTFVAPNEKALRVPFKKEFDSATELPPGFISKRIDFDNFLVELLKKEPLITLKEGCELTKIERTNNGLHLEFQGGLFQLDTPLLIGADGAYSIVTKQLANIKMEPAHYCAGVRAYFSGVKDLEPYNFIELHFLKQALPGYFWIFPLSNGLANVGIGMRSDKVHQKKINLKKLMQEIIQQHPKIKSRFQQAEMIGKIQGYGLPLGSKKRPLSGENFLLVGDAASLIDPFTGEGIGNAMMSGMFAAEQVARCLNATNFSASFLQQYDNAVYQRLWKELRLSKIMQELVNFPWLFNLVVNKANRNPQVKEMISCMFEDLDIRKQLQSPGFYFKLLFN